MKKIISVVLVSILLILALLLNACAGSNNGETKPAGDGLETRATFTRDLAGTTLNVYYWAEYVSDGSEGSMDVVKEFENLTGIKVNCNLYESNEVMYSKLKSGSVNYDLVIPSDYMIERMIKEGMLQKLDYSKITNYDLIDSHYKKLYFDENDEYTVPFSVGMVGLVYNTTMVEGTPDSWSVMWDPQYKGQVLTFNNSRDGFMIAQLKAGVDLNSTDKADWDKAADELRTLNDNLQGYVMDEVFNKMESGNAAIAAYYAGDCLNMINENEDLAMIYPKEGTNIFVDSVGILSNAQNAEAAHMFINFLLEPEVALANAEYNCYASPNTSVVNNPDYSLKDSKELYPDNIDEIKTEYYHDLPADVRSYFEGLWLRIKGE